MGVYDKFNHITTCSNVSQLEGLLNYVTNDQIISITESGRGYTVIWWSYFKDERYANVK